MSQTLVISDELYHRLSDAARWRGLQHVEQLLEAWQAHDDELAKRRQAVAQADQVRHQLALRYGQQPDSVELLRTDRER